MSFENNETSPISETFGRNASFKLEQPIGSMSISPSGRDVVLGSKDGLHIIDLDNPYAPPRYLPHRTPWEVADVQWSPFASRDYWVVSTSNQKALVWNLGAHGWRNSIEHVLHGHSRAITDINFSAFHPEILATCAVDSFVHCWDLRTPSKPAFSFSGWFAGATQVKWSRQDEHVVASSHDKYLYIWDDRKGAYPARKIEAHGTKIYGIDWNRFEPSKIVTCSLDKTIKFWNTNNDEDIPDRIIETGFPVWRARHTPFGWGLMVMPQRGSGDLHLYDRRPIDGRLESGQIPPVQVFPGHKGQVKEFLWRGSGNVRDNIDYRDFQLVTWGTDRELRLHHVSDDTLENVGYEKGVSRPQRLRVTRKGARYRTFRDELPEHILASDSFSRTESFPSTHQFSRLRGRPSTNTGMSRAPVAQFRGWLRSNKRDRRTGMHGRGATRPVTDAISWMKNVKIASWDPDTLADEIKLVGDKFKKIDFEIVDIPQRRLTYSLQSPHGDNNSSIYMRVEMRFPKKYPREAQAHVHVQKSNALSGPSHKSLAQEVQEIAKLCAENSRGCIEATVRYLLKEQSLEQLRSFLAKNSLTESKIIDAAGMPVESSDSSDDEDMNPGSLLPHLPENIRVPPLTKDCAALWSETGTLICFHPQKSKEPESFLSTLGTGRLDQSDSNKLFGGFGKFQTESLGHKQRSDDPTNDDDSSSATSENTSSYSSSVSSSSSDSIDLDSRFRDSKLGLFNDTVVDSLQRTRSAEGSRKSANQPETRLGETPLKMNVTIRTEDIIPAKKSLALEYRIFGDSVAVCEHNSKVAEKEALPEIALVWELMALIFQDETSPELRHMLREDGALTAIAGKAEALRNQASNKADLHVDGSATGLRGSGHLFGRQYLFPAILSHFDKLADIQMLATLACILILRQSDLSKDEIYQWHTHRQADLLEGLRPLVDSQVSSVYGKDLAQSSAKSAIDYTVSSTCSTPAETELDSMRRRSIGSATQQLSNLNVWNDSRGSSHAPSVITEDPNGFISALHSAIPSLSTSPESTRLSRRAESASAFPVSTASLHALAKSFSNSPPSQGTSVGARQSSRPNQVGRSPEDSSFDESRSNIRSSMSLMNVPGAGENRQASTKTGREGGIKSILKNRHAGSLRPVTRKRKLRAKLFNQDLFYTETHSNSVLLSPDDYDLCFGYIHSYLTLLEAWQLWMQRAEMMRIVGIAHRQLNSSSTPSEHRDKPQLGLEIRRCCPDCGNSLEPLLKNEAVVGWQCVSSSCNASPLRNNMTQKCSICEKIIHGLSVPCLQCGHLSCFDCGQDWFCSSDPYSPVQNRSQSGASMNSVSTSKTERTRTCPTGCGCPCATIQDVAVTTQPRTSPSTATSGVSFPPSAISNGSHKARGSTPNIHNRRGKSSVEADSAINALLAIDISRSRSVSTTKSEKTPAVSSTVNIHDDDELLPWASDHNASLNRGSGAGLSRGLNTKSSSATIKRI